MTTVVVIMVEVVTTITTASIRIFVVMERWNLVNSVKRDLLGTARTVENAIPQTARATLFHLYRIVVTACSNRVSSVKLGLISAHKEEHATPNYAPVFRLRLSVLLITSAVEKSVAIIDASKQKKFLSLQHLFAVMEY